MDRQVLLDQLGEKIRACEECKLAEGRTFAVPGFGSAKAEVLFIGEGPGKDEDLQGKPFVGAAGKFLTVLIGSIGLKREEVFITNIVKCRPPGNRDPLPEEVRTCYQYLEAQVGIIKPLLIVTLGRHSMNRFMEGLRISEVHGRPKRGKGIYSERQVYLPMYHPAAALYNPALREVLIKDFARIPKILEKIKKENGS